MYTSNTRDLSIRKMNIYFLKSTVDMAMKTISIQIHRTDESEGYTVKTKEKDFKISDYPLLQTEFLYESKQGKAVFACLVSKIPSVSFSAF